MSWTIAKKISAATFLGLAFLSCPTNLVAQQMDCGVLDAVMDKRAQLLADAYQDSQLEYFKLSKPLYPLDPGVFDAEAPKLCAVAKRIIDLANEGNKLVDDNKARCTLTALHKIDFDFSRSEAQKILDDSKICK